MHDKELASSRVWMHRTCHGKNAWCMCQIIFETILAEFSFNGVARAAHTGSVWASALDHKTTDYTVEDQPVIEAVFYQADKVIYCIWGDFRI